MDAIRKNWVKLGLTVAVLAVLSYLLTRGQAISLHDLGQSIARFGFTAIALSLTAALAQSLFMILRLYFLLERPGAPSFVSVAYALTVGQVVNTFLPARAGDVLKAVLLSREPSGRSISVMKGAGALIADRLIDISSLFILVFLSGAYRAPHLKMPTLPESWPWILLGIGAVLTIASWFIVRRRASAIARWLTDIRSGLGGLVRPGVALALVASLGAWSCEALCVKILSSYQGLHLGFEESVFVLFVLNLAIAVPVSLANLGTFEASVVFALGTFGLPMAPALAVASIHHVLQYVGICLWALVTTFLYRRQNAPGIGPIKETV